MKTVGTLAKEFRTSKGWNTTRMAKEVGTNRQSIENLEATGARTPRYIVDLARVMGVTVDELLAGTSLPQIHKPHHPMDYQLNQHLAPVERAQVATNNVAAPRLSNPIRAMANTNLQEDGDVAILERMAGHPNAKNLSVSAVELGLLFDMLPVDERIYRARAFNMAAREIILILEEWKEKSTALPGPDLKTPPA